jgi:hypothetical protein
VIERERALRQARVHLETARVAARESVEDVHDVLTRLGEALERASSIPPPPETVDAIDDRLVIAAHGRYFRAPTCEPVDLSRRRALRNILAALANQREESPGKALQLHELMGAGWPGERLLVDSGAARVYTAIATLRRMGLKPYLLRRDDGYLLNPSVAMQRTA